MAYSAEEIITKIKLRINKLDSKDYDNIERWQLLEAFDRASLYFVRSNLHGLNILKEGEEGSDRKIDDLNVLLVDNYSLPLSSKKKERNIYIKPADYLEFNRLYVKVDCGDCKDETINVYLAKNSDVIKSLRDPYRRPSFDWRESFAVITENGVEIYHNGEFDIREALLSYYRRPSRLELAGEINLSTGMPYLASSFSEFKDDTTEVIIDLAAKLISADIQDIQNFQIRNQITTENN